MSFSPRVEKVQVPGNPSFTLTTYSESARLRTKVGKSDKVLRSVVPHLENYVNMALLVHHKMQNDLAARISERRGTTALVPLDIEQERCRSAIFQIISLQDAHILVIAIDKIEKLMPIAISRLRLLRKSKETLYQRTNRRSVADALQKLYSEVRDVRNWLEHPEKEILSGNAGGPDIRTSSDGVVEVSCGPSGLKCKATIDISVIHLTYILFLKYAYSVIEAGVEQSAGRP